MEAQRRELILDLIDSPRRRSKRLPGSHRTQNELRLRDALILLRLYKKESTNTELNGRTSRWMQRHGFKA